MSAYAVNTKGIGWYWRPELIDKSKTFIWDNLSDSDRDYMAILATTHSFYNGELEITENAYFGRI